MASYNQDISNGSCYYADGKQAPSRFIPCGNVACGQRSCCESGDMCLSNSACYNGQYGVTYLAGCTDSTYDDSTCPDKGLPFQDQVWAGLIYCGSGQWVACKDQEQTVFLDTSTSRCICPSSSMTVAFIGSATLANVVSLPTATGESVGWQAGYAPQSCAGALSGAASSTSSITSTSFATSTTSSSSPSSKSSSSSSIAPSSQTLANTTTPASIVPPVSQPLPTSTALPTTMKLSIGAKAGIGVAAGVGAIAVILALIWLIMRCHRPNTPPPIEDQIRPSAPDSAAAEPKGPDGDNEELRSPAWSGHKSELPADEGVVGSPAPTYKEYGYNRTSEIEGTPILGVGDRHSANDAYKVPNQPGIFYEMPG